MVDLACLVGASIIVYILWRIMDRYLKPKDDSRNKFSNNKHIDYNA